MHVTVIDALARAADAAPDRVVFTYVSESGEARETHTFGSLLLTVRRAAAGLQQIGLADRRALVVCTPGLECVPLILGCLLARVVPIPVPPPRNARFLQAVCDDARPAAILAARDGDAPVIGEIDGVPIPVVSWSALLQRGTTPAELTRPVEDGLALLQYTSGSTSIPKGVMVSHRNLLANAAHIEDAFGIRPDDVSLLWLPLYHDMGLMGGVVQSIYSRHHTVLLPPRAFTQQPLRWLAAMTEFGATISGGPNFAYEACANAPLSDATRLDLRAWRVAFNGSETVRWRTLERFAARFAPYGFARSAFCPCYGLAEATLLVSAHRGPTLATLHVDRETLQRGDVVELPAGSERAQAIVSVGRPRGGHSVLIASPDAWCGDDAIGEICVTGPGVASGYWGRSDAAFQESPRERGDVLLRTGDLGFTHDGLLYVSGRLKDLIVVGGRNFHPEDIEAAVESSRVGLGVSCTAAFADVSGETERVVVVHELTRQGLRSDPNEITACIRQRIHDEYSLTPHAIVLIRPGTLPRTSSGKVRRRACREAYLAGSLEIVSATDGGAADVVQRPIDEASLVRGPLAETVKRCLGVARWPADRRLRLQALGVDSVRLIELRAHLDAAGVRVPMSTLFDEATVGDLERWISKAQPTVAGTPSMSTTESMTFPVSPGQRALWLIGRIDPSAGRATIARVLRLTGPLDVSALRRSLELVVARHDALRLRIDARSGESQTIGPAVCDYTEQDASGIDAHALRGLVEADAHEPFDLASHPPIRFRLYRMSAAESWLLVCAHHVAVDLWSMCRIARELAALYEAFSSGRTDPLPPPSHGFRQYIEHQEAIASGAAGEVEWHFWRDRLRGFDAPLEWPLRPASGSLRPSGVHRFALDAGLVRRLKALAASCSTTLQMTMLTACAAQVAELAGRERFLLGTLVTQRTRAAWRDAVGYAVNPVVLRVSVPPGARFADVLRHTRDELREVLDHSEYPFPTLVERLNPARVERRTPLVQVMCMLQPAPMPGEEDLASFVMAGDGGGFERGGVRFESLAADFDRSDFDLTLVTAERGNAVDASFLYDPARFDADTIARLATGYERLLERITTTGSSAGGSDAFAIHRAVERQALSSPAAVAILSDSGPTTRGDLDRHANAIARRLRAMGVGAEDRVGIFVERSAGLVAAMLGVLKAGAAFVPLDPGFPAARLRTIAERAALSVTLASGDLVASLPARMRCPVALVEWSADQHVSEPVEAHVTADSLAYVMFTSGSTGIPKGVMVSHGNVSSFFGGMDEAVGCDERDTVLAVTSISFDISILELLWTLSRGCRVVIAGGRAAASGPSGHSLSRAIREHAVSLLQCTPSFLRMASLDPSFRQALGGVRSVLLGGEPVPHALIAYAHEAGAGRIFNMYGPTETTVWSGALKLDPSDPAVRVGGAIAGTTLHLLDADMRPVSGEAAGEIVIGGAGVARGYLDNPRATAERFVPDPFCPTAGCRLYRTGDRARRDGQDGFQLLGRLDQQIKLRGHRIEPGEIEALLNALPGVRAAVALKATYGEDDERLAAFVVLGPDGDASMLRACITEQLPPYMVPSELHVKEELPLLPNGKVDRGALAVSHRDSPPVAPSPGGSDRAAVDEGRRRGAMRRQTRMALPLLHADGGIPKEQQP